MLLGLVPGFALILGTNLRAFGTLRSPDLDGPPVWVVLLVILGGGAAVLLGGYGILSRFDLDDRTRDLLMAFILGNAFVGPVACHHVWLTREHWRKGGAAREEEADLGTFIRAEKRAEERAPSRRPRLGRREGG